MHIISELSNLFSLFSVICLKVPKGGNP